MLVKILIACLILGACGEILKRPHKPFLFLKRQLLIDRCFREFLPDRPEKIALRKQLIPCASTECSHQIMVDLAKNFPAQLRTIRCCIKTGFMVKEFSHALGDPLYD